MRHIICLAFLVLLVGCTASETTTSEVVKYVPPNEISNNPEVYFCPRQDCEYALLSALNRSERTIHCAFYELNLPQVIEVLKLKSEYLDVKVVVDDQYYEELAELDFVRKDTSSQYSHNKFCILDGKVVTTGSMNPTENGAYSNKNNLVIIESGFLAKNYEDEFSELWAGEFGKGAKVRYPSIVFNGNLIENYFCPEDGCGERIKEQILLANQSIHFLTFSFTHTAIANAIVLKALPTKGLFEKQQKSKYSRLELLEFQGFDVRYDNFSAKMHNKVFIIDNSTVITGSFNPSANADTKNDENILIIHDKELAAKYLEEFDYLWANG